MQCPWDQFKNTFLKLEKIIVFFLNVRPIACLFVNRFTHNNYDDISDQPITIISSHQPFKSVLTTFAVLPGVIEGSFLLHESKEWAIACLFWLVGTPLSNNVSQMVQIQWFLHPALISFLKDDTSCPNVTRKLILDAKILLLALLVKCFPLEIFQSNFTILEWDNIPILLQLILQLLLINI